MAFFFEENIHIIICYVNSLIVPLSFDNVIQFQFNASEFIHNGYWSIVILFVYLINKEIFENIW